MDMDVNNGNAISHLLGKGSDGGHSRLNLANN